MGIQLIHKTIFVLAFILLTSCGGGGGGGSSTASNPTTVSTNGTVLDGYLYNAQVFLDLNGNGQYDSGEPETTTNSTGGYTLNATSDQFASHSVVVNALAGTTIDQSNPNTPITSAYSLTAPVGQTTVTPLTTQVAAKVATGLSLSAATTAVQTQLGLTGVNVLGDYIATPSNAAQNTAAAIALILQSVQSQSTSSTTLAAKLSSVSSNITSSIVPNLSSIQSAASPAAATTIVVNVLNSAPAIYSVGGTISGLTGSGLTITNGTGTSSPSSGATTFTLSGSQSSGSTYQVLISQQPTNQTCKVTNGSGTITNIPVNNVSISCTTNPNVVSGIISGLTASGLVLQNGTESIAISSGANTFSFATNQTIGSSYSVSITSQPVGLTCSLSNSIGNMVQYGVNNVKVTCASYGYTIGGQISGLSASGLVLQNGSDSIQISSGGTSYTLTNKVAFGGDYTVSIKAQPLGYTCSVNNGVGIMGSGNITSIQVTCSVQTFTLSGTITGNTASADLILVDNQGETVTVIPYASSFAFSNPLPYGSSYSVTAFQQPTGLWCLISNGSGTNINSNVNNISISCGIPPSVSASAIENLNLNGFNHTYSITGYDSSGNSSCSGSVNINQSAIAASNSIPVSNLTGNSNASTTIYTYTGNCPNLLGFGTSINTYTNGNDLFTVTSQLANSSNTTYEEFIRIQPYNGYFVQTLPTYPTNFTAGVNGMIGEVYDTLSTGYFVGDKLVTYSVIADSLNSVLVTISYTQGNAGSALKYLPINYIYQITTTGIATLTEIDVYSGGQLALKAVY